MHMEKARPITMLTLLSKPGPSADRALMPSSSAMGPLTTSSGACGLVDINSDLPPSGPIWGQRSYGGDDSLPPRKRPHARDARSLGGPELGQIVAEIAVSVKTRAACVSQSGAGRGLRLSGSSPVAGEDSLLIGGLSVLSAAEVSL